MQTRAEEFHKLADHAFLAQGLGYSQHQVGRGCAFGQAVLQTETDDLRDQHGYRLAQHGGLGFDSADAPAEHAETVDHGGMRVGADQRVGIGKRLARLTICADENDARQVLQIDLVNDTGVGRHNREILECRLPPTQEGIALLITLEFQLGIELKRLWRAELVHLHRVVNHQLGRLQRIDQIGVSTQRLHSVAHGRQIDHGRHAGEILQ